MAFAVATDSRGNVIVTGLCRSNDVLGTAEDYVTLAYSSVGMPLWTNHIQAAHGHMASFGCHLAVGTDDSIYLAGSADRDPSSTSYNFAVAKLVMPPQIRFSAISRFAGAPCRLTIEAPSNSTYRLEASADLAAWATLTNFTLTPAPSVQYTDNAAPIFPRRFYRTVWQPWAAGCSLAFPILLFVFLDLLPDFRSVPRFRRSMFNTSDDPPVQVDGLADASNLRIPCKISPVDERTAHSPRALPPRVAGSSRFRVRRFNSSMFTTFCVVRRRVNC